MQETKELRTGIREVKKHGNIVLQLSGRQFREAGFDYGDVITVTVRDRQYDMPVCYNYAQADRGFPVCVCDEAEDDVTLAVNYGDLASETGNRMIWDECGDDEETVTLILKQAGAYKARLSEGSLVKTNRREDYADLSDEQFANFREIHTKGMRRHILYRSSSPVDPELGRNVYADHAAAAAGIRTFINLADSEQEACEHEGFQDSYYASGEYICLDMSYDLFFDDFREKTAAGIRFMLGHEGPYLIHCKEGKDRTGFMAAILEAFAGADPDEITSDYLETFRNLFRLKENDVRLAGIAETNLTASLQTAFQREDLKAVSLQKEAEVYLKGIGLSCEEILRLKQILTGS